MVVEERMKDTKQTLADRISEIISITDDIVKIVVIAGGREIEFGLDPYEIAKYLVPLFTITNSNKIFVDFQAKHGIGYTYRYYGNLNTLTLISSYRNMTALQSEIDSSTSFNRKGINPKQAGPLNNIKLRSRKKW